MKRIDLVKEIERRGGVLLRHGGKHDWFQNPHPKMSQSVPGHREIVDSLARHILKMLSD
jgi:mRNA interferase HicA